MGRCADKNGPAEAFSELEIASYPTRSTTMLGLHRSSDVTFGSRGLGSPSLKLAKLNNVAFWPKSPNLMSAKFSRYMVKM